jgi:platelet-activating factor acetylhydrolase
VGSVDVEIPVSELQSPSPTPSVAADLPTVAFRIFYPCQPDSRQKGARWIPSPQREYLSAYARFLGANNYLSQFFSLVPQLLYYISIPVHENARLLEPNTSNTRWPVMMFSHGLGGSRNSYSHVVGSLASHGIVVVAPDHRDGSSPISFIHTPSEKEKIRRVEYKKVAHNASTEVYEARDNQLRIRLWELGLVHDALLKIDESRTLSNVAESHKKHTDLSMFAQKLNVHQPGAITFAGHSFGAATAVQFVKSVFYRPSSDKESSNALFSPSKSSSIVNQITPSTPVALLDLWGLPIQSPTTAWLRKYPMPCYNSSNGGSNLLAVLSEAFYKWSSNLQETKQAVAKPSNSNPDVPGPHIFYPIASAHLSQSDFGVLFPWVTTKVFGAKEPERVLKLNVRAILQVLRNSGVEVADTSVEDLELEDATQAQPIQDDKILSRKKDSVRDWITLNTNPEPEATRKTSKGPSDAVMEGEVLGEMVHESGR